MALRVLRLAAVASILAFGLTARAITPAYAHASHQVANTTTVAAPSTNLAEPLPSDPPLIDPQPSTDPAPPTDPPPSDPPPATDPPPSDPPIVAAGPPATDPSPTAAPSTDPTAAPDLAPAATSAPSPSDPATPAPIDTATPAPIDTPIDTPTPTIVAPVPADAPAVAPAPADPPAVDTPPADSPPAAEPTPATTDAPSVNEPAIPAPFETPVPEPTPTTGEPDLVDQPVVDPFPLLPVAVPLHDGVSTAPAHSVSSDAARAGAAPPAHDTAAVTSATPSVKAPRLPAPDWVPHMTGLSLPEQLEPVAAGIVAGLAVTNRAPASVAVAIEFGRVGGGWAGAIVFNLWLSRQMRMRRMSQRQLAALSGVDHSTISRLLLHDRRPSLATATKLARALRQVEGESDTADYFERIPEETIFPSRRVEMALRADELLDEDEVRRLMSLYLDARRRRQAAMASNGRWSNGPPATPARAVHSGGAPDSRR